MVISLSKSRQYHGINGSFMWRMQAFGFSLYRFRNRGYRILSKHFIERNAAKYNGQE
jgi:hypothetical protein